MDTWKRSTGDERNFDAELDRLINDFRGGGAKVCKSPPFSVRDSLTTVYTIARHPGWFFLTTKADENRDSLLVVTARFREVPGGDDADVDFEARPEALRAYDLEQWVYRQMQICANTRAAYPDCKLACHNRDIELKAVLAEAKQQKVDEQHKAALSRPPAEQYNRGRAKERKLIIEYLGGVEQNLINPETIAVIHSLKLAFADGKHDPDNVRN